MTFKINRCYVTLILNFCYRRVSSHIMRTGKLCSILNMVCKYLVFVLTVFVSLLQELLSSSFLFLGGDASNIY